MTKPRGANLTHLEWLHNRRSWEAEPPLVDRVEIDYEIAVQPGHCPNCSLDYELARALTGRREVSNHCSICEDEEGYE